MTIVDKIPASTFPQLNDTDDFEENCDELSGFKPRSASGVEKSSSEETLEEGAITEEDRGKIKRTSFVHKRGFGPTASSMPNQVKRVINIHENSEDTGTGNINSINQLSKSIVDEVRKQLKVNSCSNSTKSIGDLSSNTINTEFSNSQSNSNSDIFRKLLLTKKMSYQTIEKYLFLKLESSKLYYTTFLMKVKALK